MSITDEMREWWVRKFPVMDKELHDDFTAIADRIDAEHQKAVEELKAKRGDMWLKGYAVCHAELIEGHPVIAADLEKAGWVRLPVDADGEYIHIGDELDYLEALHPDVPSRFKVQDMFYFGNGEWRLRAFPATYEPEKCRHYHTPTVEDVLREFADIVRKERVELATISEDTIAEYAAKLRLAEEDA